MKIDRFVIGPVGTNCYIVRNEDTDECFVTDPAACPPELVGHIRKEGLNVKAVLLTHGHFDHIMGIDGFLKEYSVPVYVHEDDLKMMEDPQWNQSAIYTAGYTFAGAAPLRDGQTLSLAGYDFQVLHTPGHTPGGCCYYVKSEGVLFSGDTLFQRSVGRTDFEGSSTKDLIRGIREKLMVLPDDTHVYPGHMGETLIGYEKRENPFIQE